MKRISLFIAISAFLIWIGCTNEDDGPSKSKLIGTWIEKYPEKFDGISDTLVFGEDSTVQKHFYFKGSKYSVHDDTIAFLKAGRLWQFHFEYTNTYEMLIYNFLEQTVSEQSKDVYFTKIN